KNPRRQSAHRRSLKLPRRATRAFLAAVPIVTEQSRDRLSAAQKVHLEAVRLFLGARFGIDAPNIFFRIGVCSFFHDSCLKSHPRQTKRDCKRASSLMLDLPRFRLRQMPALPLLVVLRGGQKRIARMPRDAQPC